MKTLLMTLLLSAMPALAFAADKPFACNMRALTTSERLHHGVLSRRLLSGSATTSPADFRSRLPRFSGANREQNDRLVDVLRHDQSKWR